MDYGDGESLFGGSVGGEFREEFINIFQGIFGALNFSINLVSQDDSLGFGINDGDLDHGDIGLPSNDSAEANGGEQEGLADLFGGVDVTSKTRDCDEVLA